MTNKDETNHQRDRLIDELFFAEDNEVIDSVCNSNLLMNLMSRPGVDLLPSNLYDISRGIKFVILNANVNLFIDELKENKSPDERKLNKRLDILLNLDKLTDNLEGLITELEGNSDFVGDKSAVIINQFLANNFNSIKYSRIPQYDDYDYIKSNPNIDEWTEYLECYLRLLTANMFPKNTFSEYNKVLSGLLQHKK